MPMSRALLATSVVAFGLAVSPAIAHANVECPSGWEFGPSLRLLQSDDWTVTVATAGRTVGGAAAAIPPNNGALWRGTGEGGSDGMTVAFGVGFDNGTVLHYTGVIDPTTGAVTVAPRRDHLESHIEDAVHRRGRHPACCSTPGDAVRREPNAPARLARQRGGQPEAPTA